MVRNNGIGPNYKLGRFFCTFYGDILCLTEGSPSGALFNYLLDVVLNRLCLRCLQRFGEAGWKEAEGKGREPGGGGARAVTPLSGVWALGYALLCYSQPLKAGLLLKHFWATPAPPLVSTGVLVGSDGSSVETQAISAIS